MLFITAGMGGGTGTGAAPVVAQVAKELGILTVAVVTKPFEMEGNKRSFVADHGIAELSKYCDSLITIPNQKLLTVLGPQTTLLDAIEFIGDSLDQESPDTNKVIILITDGEERSSRINQKELIQKLNEHKTSVFAIGLVQQLDKSRSKAVDLLKLITKETGGRVVFPKSDRQNLQSLLAELAIPIQ